MRGGPLNFLSNRELIDSHLTGKNFDITDCKIFNAWIVNTIFRCGQSKGHNY